MTHPIPNSSNYKRLIEGGYAEILPMPDGFSIIVLKMKEGHRIEKGDGCMSFLSEFKFKGVSYESIRNGSFEWIQEKHS